MAFTIDNRTIRAYAAYLTSTMPELFAKMKPWQRKLVRWHVEHGWPVKVAVQHVLCCGYSPALERVSHPDYPTRDELGLAYPRRSYRAFFFDDDYNEFAVCFVSASKSARHVKCRAVALLVAEYGKVDDRDVRVMCGRFRLGDLVEDGELKA